MSDATILFGIKNCDTVKKARKWMDDHGVEYRFHDFRAEGLKKDKLQDWINTLGSETFINTRSTTWKQLSEHDQALATGKIASAVVLANPTLIKRPVLEHADTTIVGFKPEEYEALLLK